MYARNQLDPMTLYIATAHGQLIKAVPTLYACNTELKLIGRTVCVVTHCDTCF